MPDWKRSSLERRLERLKGQRERIERLHSTPSPYLLDPCRWATERLGLTLWSKEREILEGVRDHHAVAVRSCTTVGKSFSASTLACWWIDSHPPGKAFVLTTAPTGNQVKGILWQEINAKHSAGKLTGRTTQTEWWIGQTQVGIGRKPSEYNVSAFQGYHREHVLVVFDEACGVPRSLFEAGDTIAPLQTDRVLAIGNPDNAATEFGRICRDGSGWHLITIGYADAPAFTGEAVPDSLRDRLIGPFFVKEAKRKWGEESALFASKVLGVFPEAGADATVPYGWAQRARERELPSVGPVEAGLDVGEGSDRTVLRVRRGAVAAEEHVWLDPDPMRQVGNVALALAEHSVTRVKVDAGGPGWAIAGRLKELSGKQNVAGRVRGETTHEAEVVALKFGETAHDAKQFTNLRAELYWNGRELCRLGAWDLSAANVDDDLVAELCATKYEVEGSHSRIKLEPKKEVVKRLGRSPDRAEALLLAFYDAHQAAVMTPASVLTSQRVD